MSDKHIDGLVQAFVNHWESLVEKRAEDAFDQAELRKQAKQAAKFAMDSGATGGDLGRALEDRGLGSYRSVRRLLTGK